VDNGATLRAYRRPSGATELWEGGALVADERPATDSRAAVGDVRTIQFTVVRARGDVVAALADVQFGARRFVGRLESRDGGASWR
jgi:hypothetical protein